MGTQCTMYLDHAATTFVRPAMMDVMIPCFTVQSGNPLSLCDIARDSEKAIDAVRAQIAQVPGAEPDAIYFTSGGNESDNRASRGVALSNKAVVRARDGQPPITMHGSVPAEEGIHWAINDSRVKTAPGPWKEQDPGSPVHNEVVTCRY